LNTRSTFGLIACGHFCEHHPAAIFGGIHQHLDGGLPLRSALFGLAKFPDVVRDVAERSRRRAAGQGNGLIEWTIPGHNAHSAREM
jgi:hypothetical protein